MSWFSQSANEVTAAKQHCLIFVAVDFNFTSGHVQLWSGIGDIIINGSTFAGVGHLGSIDIPPDRNTLTAESKRYQLSGVDPALVPEADINASYGRDVTEYFGFLDTESRALVVPPEVSWEGYIDTIRRVDGAKPVIEVNAENRMVLLDREDTWRNTNEHQQMFYPDDAGFDQVNAILLKTTVWSGKNADPATRPTYTYPYYGTFPLPPRR